VPVPGRAAKLLGFLWCSWMVAWAMAVPGGADHPGQADAWLDVVPGVGRRSRLPASPRAVRLGPELDHGPTTYEHIAERGDRSVASGSAHSVAFQRLG
jgi:hypothetical protein